MLKYVFRKYSPEFRKIFLAWKKKLSRILPKTAKIMHIGSTAVPGLGGKGIIDIIVLVNKKKLSKARISLIGAGLEYKPHPGNRSRYFFQKSFKKKGKFFRVHVHLTSSKPLLAKDLAIVALLKSDEQAKKEYEKVKKAAVKFSKQDGKKYRAFKNNFLKRLAKKAILKQNHCN